MRIGIVDPVHAILAEQLIRAGHEVLELHGRTAAERSAELDRCEGLVVRSSPIDAARIDSSSGLRFVGRVGAGLENIDVAHCRDKGIKVLNSPEGNRDGVGESCVLLLLAMLKHVIPADRAVHSGNWLRETMRGTDLRGKTVGIIGFGQMGSAFAEKLRGFGVRVLGHDKYRSGFSDSTVLECDLDQVLRESDVISLHSPLTETTRGQIAMAEFRAMKRRPLLINTSRGGLVDEADLVRALDEGLIAGAGFDVTSSEPPPLDNPLLQVAGRPNVILTPHVAWASDEAQQALAEQLIDNIEAFVAGRGQNLVCDPGGASA